MVHAIVIVVMRAILTQVVPNQTHVMVSPAVRMLIAQTDHVFAIQAMKVTLTQVVQNLIPVMASDAAQMLIAQMEHVSAIQAMKVTPIQDVRQFVYQEVVHLAQDKQALVAVLKFRHLHVKTVQVLCTILAGQKPAQNKVKRIVMAHVSKKRHVVEDVRVARNVKMEPVLIAVFRRPMKQDVSMAR